MPPRSSFFLRQDHLRAVGTADDGAFQRCRQACVSPIASNQQILEWTLRQGAVDSHAGAHGEKGAGFPDHLTIEQFDGLRSGIGIGQFIERQRDEINQRGEPASFHG